MVLNRLLSGRPSDTYRQAELSRSGEPEEGLGSRLPRGGLRIEAGGRPTTLSPLRWPRRFAEEISLADIRMLCAKDKTELCVGQKGQNIRSLAPDTGPNASSQHECGAESSRGGGYELLGGLTFGPPQIRFESGRIQARTGMPAKRVVERSVSHYGRFVDV